MFIINGNQRKIDHVWQHIKRQHTGEKVAVVGYPKRMPENYLRNKQLTFYESLTIPTKWLDQAEDFLKRFEEQYDGVIFYVDCSEKEAEQLATIAQGYRSQVTVTVAGGDEVMIRQHELPRAA